MLCTECHVRKGPELAQVRFDPADLFDACEINHEISLTNMISKEAGKVILYHYLSFKSVYVIPCM